MKFLVEWQMLVYDVFHKLKEVKNKTPFEISAISFDLARERAEAKINRTVITNMREQTGKQRGDVIVGEIVVLIDEAGVRHQLQER